MYPSIWVLVSISPQKAEPRAFPELAVHYSVSSLRYGQPFFSPSIHSIELQIKQFRKQIRSAHLDLSYCLWNEEEITGGEIKQKTIVHFFSLFHLISSVQYITTVHTDICSQGSCFSVLRHFSHTSEQTKAAMYWAMKKKNNTKQYIKVLFSDFMDLFQWYTC